MRSWKDRIVLARLEVSTWRDSRHLNRKFAVFTRLYAREPRPWYESLHRQARRPAIGSVVVFLAIGLVLASLSIRAADGGAACAAARRAAPTTLLQARRLPTSWSCLVPASQARQPELSSP